MVGLSECVHVAGAILANLQAHEDTIFDRDPSPDH